MTRLLISSAACALLVACSGGSDGIEPGEWEFTMAIDEISAPEAPEAARAQVEATKPPPQVQTVCVTPEEAADPDGGMFAPQGDDTCQNIDFTMADGRMDMEAQCQAPGMPGQMTMTMDGAYDRTSFTTDLDMEIAETPVGPMTMSGTMTGEHKGDC